MNSVALLKELYARNSKHSNYQILSGKLTSIIGDDQIVVKSRYERERLDYILDKIDLNGKTVLDIGGNSGFFTFESLDNGARSVHYYEGNKEHSEFVEKAAEVLQCSDKVEVTNNYYTFESGSTDRYDVVFLLNVLHHLGDDFGDKTLSVDAAKQLMMHQLNNMVLTSSCLVFQLGFCWKGDRNAGLFSQGTKKELIDFVVNSVKDIWDIKYIGIPTRIDDHIRYVDPDEHNILRDDSLGEFLNRPLFIMHAR